MIDKQRFGHPADSFESGQRDEGAGGDDVVDRKHGIAVAAAHRSQAHTPEADKGQRVAAARVVVARPDGCHRAACGVKLSCGSHQDVDHPRCGSAVLVEEQDEFCRVSTGLGDADILRGGEAAISWEANPMLLGGAIGEKAIREVAAIVNDHSCMDLGADCLEEAYELVRLGVPGNDHGNDRARDGGAGHCGVIR
jgi:hypothetical protein